MEDLKTISINNYIYSASCASTNAFLSDYISKNNPQHNICVYTYNQSEGRGQIGRNWFSDVNKNITLSYLVQFSNFNIQNQFQLNMAVSIGVVSFLKKFIKEEIISIKWPNDIYVHNKKICGILIQNQLKGRLISSSIIGIGLNVNQDRFPDDLPNPTSLQIETQTEYDKLDLIHQLSTHISAAIQQLKLYPKTLLEKYLKNLFLINEEHEFINLKTNKSFKGIIKGVSAEGKLLIQIINDLVPFNFREVRFVIPSRKTK